jgi:heme-degrading monooxygenase HmoA
MIARMWGGSARPDNADAYVRHLQQKTLPALASLPGHRGAYVLRRDAGDRVAFTVITLWDSVDAIAAFSGGDPEKAVVPPDAAALLASYDTRAVHWEVAHRTLNPEP